MTDFDEVISRLVKWHTHQAREHWLEAKWWAELGGEKVSLLDTGEIDIPEWINSQVEEKR